ncbi:MAG TPA: hypothetical protein VGR91_03435 [Stellaceae bacterium]|nr:hypothetical protein [Stellaceae bacterium]
MSVLLRHPVSGQSKVLPEGWSWGCFLGVGLLGRPLFRRGLAVWGAVMVSVNTLALALSVAPGRGGSDLASALAFVALALDVFLGLKANEMAINRCRNLGWEVADGREARR